MQGAACGLVAACTSNHPPPWHQSARYRACAAGPTTYAAHVPIQCKQAPPSPSLDHPAASPCTSPCSQVTPFNPILTCKWPFRVCASPPNYQPHSALAFPCIRYATCSADGTKGRLRPPVSPPSSLCPCEACAYPTSPHPPRAPLRQPASSGCLRAPTLHPTHTASNTPAPLSSLGHSCLHCPCQSYQKKATPVPPRRTEHSGTAVHRHTPPCGTVPRTPPAAPPPRCPPQGSCTLRCCIPAAPAAPRRTVAAAAQPAAPTHAPQQRPPSQPLLPRPPSGPFAGHRCHPCPAPCRILACLSYPAASPSSPPAECPPPLGRLPCQLHQPEHRAPGGVLLLPCRRPKQHR